MSQQLFNRYKWVWREKNWNLIEFNENIRFNQPIMLYRLKKSHYKECSLLVIHDKSDRLTWQRISITHLYIYTYILIICSTRWYNLIEWFSILCCDFVFLFFFFFIWMLCARILFHSKKKMGVPHRPFVYLYLLVGCVYVCIWRI